MTHPHLNHFYVFYPQKFPNFLEICVQNVLRTIDDL